MSRVRLAGSAWPYTFIASVAPVVTIDKAAAIRCCWNQHSMTNAA